MSYFVQEGPIYFNLIDGFDYGENVSTIINVDPANIGSSLLIFDNENTGVEWKNVAINANYPIMLEYNESLNYPIAWKRKYDVRATLDVWYDTTSGDPSETHTFFLWNDGADDGTESNTKRVIVDITERLSSFGIDFSRVKKVRFLINGGIKDYENHPGNNFTLESYPIRLSGHHFLTTFYLEQAAVSTSQLSFGSAGNPIDFTVYANGAWSLSDDAFWLTCSPTSGSGITTVTASATENFKFLRYATITVNVNGSTETIDVIQNDSSAPPST